MRKKKKKIRYHIGEIVSWYGNDRELLIGLVLEDAFEGWFGPSRRGMKYFLIYSTISGMPAGTIQSGNAKNWKKLTEESGCF